MFYLSSKSKRHLKFAITELSSLAGQPTSAWGGKGLVNMLYSFWNVPVYILYINSEVT